MDNSPIVFEESRQPDLRKLRMKVKENGGRIWFLDDLELPYVLSDSVKIEWRGGSALVTLSIEVEVEGLGNPPE